MDLLENISENKEYFSRRICSVFSFVPRNQPLYSFFCFVAIPAFMAESVYLKQPLATGDILNKMVRILDIERRFPNIVIADLSRDKFLEFARERVSECEKQDCLGSAVTFTGTGINAKVILGKIGKSALFVGNGSSHNPVVVASGANVGEAVRSVICLKSYNSGQDCAAPNSILVHKGVLRDFYRELKKQLALVGVGSYDNPNNRIGPLSSDAREIGRIKNILSCNSRWLDVDFPGKQIDALTMAPAIISRPLSFGGSYTESFAPIFLFKNMILIGNFGGILRMTSTSGTQLT